MPDDLDPDNSPAITADQLAAANAATTAAQLESARLRAVAEFPTVTEDLLSNITDPAEVRSFAERMHNHIVSQQQATAPVATDAVAPSAAPGAVPTPIPGVGAVPTPGDVNQARKDELLEKVLDKTATRGTSLNGRPKASEAVELFNLTMVDGFKELAEGRRR